MKIQLFLSLLSFYSLSVLSQESNTLETNSALKSLNTLNMASGGIWIPGKTLPTSAKGSFYLFPSSSGQFSVMPVVGDPISLYNLNYNLKSKTLESKISKDSVFQFNTEQIDYVIHHNLKYKVVNDSQIKGLLLEICDGKNFKLYKESYVVLQEGTLNPLTQEKMTDDRYLQMHNYYVYSNEKYEKVKLSKKTILKYLSDKENIVKEYVSKNNLSYTSDTDLNKIFNYYNLL